jgi:hypothetical protein
MNMESRAKLLGHPIHQMLIVFPLGLLAMAVVFDLLAIGLANRYWSEITTATDRPLAPTASTVSSSFATDRFVQAVSGLRYCRERPRRARLDEDATAVD